MAAVSMLTRKYNQYYAARPVLTTMITNAVRFPLLYTQCASSGMSRDRHTDYCDVCAEPDIS